MNIPRVIIAGTHSGVGKTMLATALMRTLADTGLKVQPFKVGPDYIDPGYHHAATGYHSRNLDVWMVAEEGVRELFYRSALRADISVIEGVMGLFDGRGSVGEGSTADIARILNAPVVLILDVRSMSRSAAALVLGYKMFEPDINIGGVILNRVGSERHYEILKEAIEFNTGVPVLGGLEFNCRMELPERHLGLLPTLENENLGGFFDLMTSNISRSIDVEGIVKLAEAAPAYKTVKECIFSQNNKDLSVNLGVVIDDAFNFYYQDSLDLLTTLGARIVPCSSLRGRLSSDLDGLYIGGGFPELFAEEISNNKEFIEDVRSSCKRGMPIYAECGGMMLLSESIIDFEGREYPMVGIIPGKSKMLKKRAGLGYVIGKARKDNLFTAAGKALKGHEFHYSVLEGMNKDDYAYTLERQGEALRMDGFARGNLLASYLHLHLCGCPEEAARFVSACLDYRGKKVL